MTSPNEPGTPKAGDGPNGDGSVERAGARHGAPPAQGGRAPEGGDGPPWQRGGARPQDPGPRHNEPFTEKRPSGQAGGAEGRLNRFISGTAAPGAAPAHAREPETATTRGETSPTDAYASELPDLSGPVPRSPHRKPAPERPALTKRYLDVAPGARPHVPVDRRAPLADFAAIAADYPVFRVVPAGAPDTPRAAG